MMVPPEVVPDLIRERLGCPRCAVLITTLENLLDDAPIYTSRDVQLPENDDDGYTVVWQRTYIDALIELRKYRPWPVTDRCALCNNTGSLMVEGRRGPITETACPNCAHPPFCPTCEGKRRIFPTGYDAHYNVPCPDCAGGKGD